MFLLMRYLLLSVICVLSSCIGTHVDQGLAALGGENISTAFKVMGYPSRKMDLGKGAIYTWSNISGGVTFVPGTAQAFSMVGSTPVTTTVSYSTAVPTTLSCEISLETNQAGTIVGSSYQGQFGALAAYSNSLRDYAKAKKQRLAATQTGTVVAKTAATTPAQ